MMPTFVRSRDTVFPRGQTASDGFAALADLDANQDGVVNASDAAFASLRVWRDLDQDGVTDAGLHQILTARVEDSCWQTASSLHQH